jgi:hypothetical protein
MCMYVYVCVCMCMYVYVCVCIFVSICVRVCVGERQPALGRLIHPVSQNVRIAFGVLFSVVLLDPHQRAPHAGTRNKLLTRLHLLAGYFSVFQRGGGLVPS